MEVILGKLGEVARTQLKEAYGYDAALNEHFEEIELNLPHIKYKVATAETHNKGDPNHRKLLGQIKDKTDEAESVLDMISYMAFKKQLRQQNAAGEASKVHACLFTSHNFGKRFMGLDSTKHKLAQVVSKLSKAKEISNDLPGDENKTLDQPNDRQILLPHLKPCLMFCTMFPKGCKLDRNELVDLWIAQGYVEPNHDGDQTIDQTGHKYFDEFVELELLHKTEDGYYVMKGSCYDELMSEKVIRDEWFAFDAKNPRLISSSTRHLCITYDGVKDLSAIVNRAPTTNKLRTLKFNCRFRSRCKLNRNALLKLKCLRALDLDGVELTGTVKSFYLPTSLRFLHVSGKLPKSMCQLYLLETLIITDSNVEALPCLGNLPSLRKLKLVNMHALEIIDSKFYGNGGFPALEDLEFDSLSSLSKWEGREEKMYDVSLFSHLRRLVVKKCDELMQLQSSDSSSLTDISINWEDGDDPNPRLCCSKVQLVRISEETDRLKMRSSVVPMQNNLAGFAVAMVKLEINCNGKLALLSPGIAYLICLEELKICNLNENEVNGDEESNNKKSTDQENDGDTLLPSSLEHLELFNCIFNKTKLPELLKGLTRLQRCVIRNCRNLGPCEGLSHLRCLEELEIVEPYPEITLQEDLPRSILAVTIGGWAFNSTMESWLRHLQKLHYLDRLKITMCSWLTSLNSAQVTGLKALKELAIENCNGLTDLQGISTFPSLEKLEVKGCPNLNQVSEWDKIPISQIVELFDGVSMEGSPQSYGDIVEYISD